MKTPIQKRIEELTEIKEQFYNEENHAEYNLYSRIIEELTNRLPDEEEALKEAYSDGRHIFGIYSEDNWFNDTYNGKDE